MSNRKLVRKVPEALSDATVMSGMPSISERDFVTSLARGLSVIRAFSREAPEQTVSEIAKETGLSAAAVRRFLLTLKHLGYVGTSGNRFMLRPKLLELGYTYLSSMQIEDLIQPILDELGARTGESSGFVIRYGMEAVYIAQHSMQKYLRAYGGVGFRVPLYVSAPGRVLLASLSEADLSVYLDNLTIRHFTSKTIKTKEHIRKAVRETRARDYALVTGEWETMLNMLAVPVRDASGSVVASVACSLVHTPLPKSTSVVLPTLRKTANDLSDVLKHNPVVLHSFFTD
jgi:IclR family pca regulon transcriptional regulator